MPQDPAPSSRPGQLAALLLLALLVVAAFGPVLGHGFLVLDDRPWIVQNPQVQAGLTADGVRWAFTTEYGGAWQPLTWLSWMADRSLFGESPRGFHLTNLLLHLVSTLLLFEALRRLLRSAGAALAIAALWAVHPVQVESVAWVAERKGLLAGLFWMIALLAYAWNGPLRRLTIFAAMVLGAMAKSAVMLPLPFALLLLDYWPRGVLEPLQAHSWGRALRGKIELFGLVPAIAFVGYAAQAGAGAVREVAPDRAEQVVYAFAESLRLLLLPTDLNPLRVVGPEGIGTGVALFAAVVLLALTGGFLHGRRWFRPGVTGWLWFLGTLVPFSGLVAVGGHFMAERYLLIPSVGVFLVAVVGLGRLCTRAGVPARVQAAAVLVVVVGLGAITVRQVGYWQDSRTLFARAVEIDPRNHLAHYWFGEALAADERSAEAAVQFARARELHPGYDLAWFEEGSALLAVGQFDPAARAFEEYLRLRPHQFKGWMNLGVAHARAGRYAPALQCFERAVEIAPENQLALTNRDRARQALEASRPER